MKCRFCGEQIEHQDVNDHRERCAGFPPPLKQRIRDENHEKRVKEFLGRKHADL
jgi:hypothetical protein